MPLIDGKYVSPVWVNGGAPALDAPELQGMTDTVQNTQAALGDYQTPAQKLGLTGDLSVGASLGVLADVGNLHVWKRTLVLSEPQPEVPGSYTLGPTIDEMVLYTQRTDQSTTLTMEYGSSIVVSIDGSIIINNPTTESLPNYTWVNRTSTLRNKFIRVVDVTNVSFSPNIKGNVYKMGSSGEFKSTTAWDTTTNSITDVQLVTSTPGTPAIPAGTHIDYLVNVNRGAYQEGSDAVPAGYTLGNVLTNKEIVDYASKTMYVTISRSTSLSVADNGAVSLAGTIQEKNLQAQTWPNESNYSEYKGCFCKVTNRGGQPFDGAIFFLPNTTTAKFAFDGDELLYATEYQAVTGYPAIPADTTIEYMGVVGDKARVQVVEYVGTGTYGENNPTTITFNFNPRAISISHLKEDATLTGAGATTKFYPLDPYTFIYPLKGYRYQSTGGGYGKEELVITWEGQTVSWYAQHISGVNNLSAADQLNYLGDYYYCIAIG